MTKKHERKTRPKVLAKTPVPEKKTAQKAEPPKVPEPVVETKALGAVGSVASSSPANDDLKAIVTEAMNSKSGGTVYIQSESDFSAVLGILGSGNGSHSVAITVKPTLQARATWRRRV